MDTGVAANLLRDRLAKRIQPMVEYNIPHMAAKMAQDIADAVLDELGWDNAPALTYNDADGWGVILIDIEDGTYRLIREDSE